MAFELTLKPSLEIKDLGSFFSTLAIFDKGAASIFHEYFFPLPLTITGITPFKPLTAYLTAWMPTASA